MPTTSMTPVDDNSTDDDNNENIDLAEMQRIIKKHQEENDYNPESDADDDGDEDEDDIDDEDVEAIATEENKPQITTRRSRNSKVSSEAVVNDTGTEKTAVDVISNLPDPKALLKKKADNAKRKRQREEEKHRETEETIQRLKKTRKTAADATSNEERPSAEDLTTMTTSRASTTTTTTTAAKNIKNILPQKQRLDPRQYPSYPFIRIVSSSAKGNFLVIPKDVKDPIDFLCNYHLNLIR